MGGIQISERDKAIQAYYDELGRYERQGVEHELALRTAFSNLLAHFAQQVKWTLIPEKTLANGARPDGVLRDASLLYRGYWEAKDTHDDLDTEITKKIARGYPTTNSIFEDTRRAVLYQFGRKVGDFDLHVPRKLADLLQLFFSYTEADIERFEQAVEVFRERIPDLAKELQALITRERQASMTFRAAFQTFYQTCQESIDPKISEAAVEEMLVQHLLTERLFRVIFNNPDFTQRNVIAVEIEKVIAALTSRAFNRNDFLKSLDPYYTAIEQAATLAAHGDDAWTERQHFLNMVYERFFQGFSVRQADTHGIVYTPQEIVNFMVSSVDEVLKREFGKEAGIGEPGVKILDPATGTGNFIVHLLRRMSARHLRQKYTDDLFCNEIMLLPYYIACLNIEHAYYEQSGEYLPFEGACFADTLDMAENVAKSSETEHIIANQLLGMSEANSTRVERERKAEIVVVIGNPPYNVGQVNENDNNKNRKYPVIDGRVRETYAKDSQATNKNKLSDAYVKFFRWATDRLRGQDGIICLVTNNSFVDQIAFDGMRKHLLQDFTAIYHLDLHGNVRRNPKLSGTTHNVFGIQVGVGITIAIRRANSDTRGLYYYRVPEDWRRERKLWFLAQASSVERIEWQELTPDERQTWLTEGLRPEFASFLPIGSPFSRSSSTLSEDAIFESRTPGCTTSRDEWVYDYHDRALADKVSRFIDAYNSDVDRWIRAGQPPDVDSFVTSDSHRIKWSESLKNNLRRKVHARFDPLKVRQAIYRPFTRTFMYYDGLMVHRPSEFQRIFPTEQSERENGVLWIKTGGDWPMFSLAIDHVADFLPQGGSQCFPYYVYDEDGSNRRENITNWALTRFREAYGPDVTKRDIFAYVYGLLHHPAYRERYAENLKRELPRIPLVEGVAAFKRCAQIGQRLMDLHLSYETQPEYPLRWVEHPEGSPDHRVTFHVKKMKLSPDHASLLVNETLTLEGIPPECFEYRLGNRSALEWVIDQYQVSEDKRSGITSDPNRADDPQYIVHLVGRVVTVSMETVKLVRALASEVVLPEPVSVTAVAN